MLARHAPDAGIISIKEQPGQLQSFGHLMTFVAKTPARVVVWLDADPRRPDWPILAQAIQRFSDRLFVIGTSDEAATIAHSPHYLGIKDNRNVVLVTGRSSQSTKSLTSPLAAFAISAGINQQLALHVQAAVLASALAARAFKNVGALSIANVQALLLDAASRGITYQNGELTLSAKHPEFALR